MTRVRAPYPLNFVSPVDGRHVIVRMPRFSLFRHVVRHNPLAWVIA